MKKIPLLIMLCALFAHMAYALPPWTYTNTGMNHTIIIDTSVHPSVNGIPLDAGDFIGVFYDSSGTLACGGYEMWTGNGAITIAAFGNDLTLPAKDGFASGEAFKWKIWRHGNGSVVVAQATYIPVGGIISDTGSYVTNGLSSLRSLTGLSQYLITSNAGPNGSINPLGVDTVTFGSNQTFHITPNGGYHVDSVIVDGVKVDSTASYTFTNVSANHTIRTTFKINTYTIAATAGANGSISPSGTVTVNYGASQKFTMTPIANYHVDSVIVDGIKVDSTTSYTFMNVTTTHTIRATFRINSYSITATTGANGSISPSGTVTVNYGANQQFTITPTTGYHVDSVIVDGIKVDSTTSYTFTSVTTTHTIRATFRINSYSITATTGANGSISPSGTVTVNYGANQQFTITPTTGYHVDSVIVDGIKVDSTTSYTFRNLTASHTIRATFRINTYTIAATAGANGSISPSGTVTVNYGASQKFTMTPIANYHVDSVIVDGVKVDSTASYTFTNATANHTIRATFKINTYTIAATAGANGSISPSGTVTVNFGASQKFTNTPTTGYHVDSVIVDGVKVDSTASYTFTSVTTNHAIRGVFRINQYTITASAGSNGTITPSGTVTVNYGGSQGFIMQPNTGYHVDSVIVDGLSVDSTFSYTFIAVTSNHTIAIRFISRATVTVDGQWNMVSIPLTVSDYRKTTLFPTATSNAFTYRGGYVQKESLANGTGYWLKFSSRQDVPMRGWLETADTIDVRGGWNMVGSISVPIAAAQITSDPAGVLTSHFFGYAQGYTTSDTIQPGRGYWVKVSQDGKLILASSMSMANASNRIRIVPSEELPPAPPEDNEPASVIPKAYALQQNYPNPFNPTTTVSFAISSASGGSFVTLKVYDVLGREVATLVNGAQVPGFKSVTWDAANVPSGVYFYRLQAGTFTETKKLLLLR